MGTLSNIVPVKRTLYLYRLQPRAIRAPKSTEKGLVRNFLIAVFDTVEDLRYLQGSTPQARSQKNSVNM